MSKTMLKIAGAAVVVAAMAMPAAAAPGSSIETARDLAAPRIERLEAGEAQRLVPVTLVLDGRIVWRGKLPANRQAVEAVAAAATVSVVDPGPIQLKPIRGERLLCTGEPWVPGGSEEHVYELVDCAAHENKPH